MRVKRQLLLLLCIVAGGCTGSANRSLVPVPSPSGSLTLTPSITESTDKKQNGCVAFDIADASGNQLCHVQTKASNTMKWAIEWRDDTTVVLSSSDIGTRAWKLRDGKATELPLPLPPELLEPGEQLAKRNSSTRDKLRFPEASIGTWIELAGDQGISIRFEKTKFQHMQPLPEDGYVPVEALGPTVRANVHNGTTDYVAEVRIRVRATTPSGSLLAEDVTDMAGRFRLIPPSESDERVFVFYSPNSPFEKSEKWSDFEISVDPIAARLVHPSDIEMGE